MVALMDGAPVSHLPRPSDSHWQWATDIGVALPWAIEATLVRPAEKVLSISGDGGFLFSAMVLETAVRLKSNLVHIIVIDNLQHDCRTGHH